MFTAYLLDKAEFTLLCRLIGGSGAFIPEKFYVDTDGNNKEKVIKRLENVGYIYRSETRTDIERTMYFLISNILNTKNFSSGCSGKRYVFRCDKLLIILEEDRLSPKKCRIIPVENELTLEEYCREFTDEEKYSQEDL